MKNEIINVPISEQRDINIVTTEIKTLQRAAQRMVVEYAVEIGRRLEEAKSMLPHGEWGTWLREEVSFSQSTAQNYMKIFREYGDQQISVFGATAKSQALGNLPITKALALLALPEDEREAFMEKNDIAAISSRELDKAIREAQEAQERARLAEEARDELTEKMTALSDQAEAARQARESAEIRAVKHEKRADALEKEKEKLLKKLEEAKKAAASEPADKTAPAAKEPKEIPEDVMKRLREEATAEAARSAEEKVKKLDEELEKAKAQAQKARREAKEIQEALEQSKKELALSDPATTVFNERFKRLQKDYASVMDSLREVAQNDAERGKKLKNALAALLNMQMKSLEEST